MNRDVYTDIGGTAEAFLIARGFDRITNMTDESYTRTYFTGKNRARKVSRLFGFVHAVVPAISQEEADSSLLVRSLLAGSAPGKETPIPVPAGAVSDAWAKAHCQPASTLVGLLKS